MNNMYNSGTIPLVDTSDTQMAQASSTNGSFSDYAFPLLGGLTAGYFMSQIMNNGLKNTAMNASYTPRVTTNISEQDKRKRKNQGFYTYSSGVLSSNKTAVSNDIKTGKIKSPTSNLTTRQQGQFTNSKSKGARYLLPIVLLVVEGVKINNLLKHEADQQSAFILFDILIINAIL